MQEIWKTIKGFEDYQVSNFGKIKSLERKLNKWDGNRTHKELILKRETTNNGYLRIMIYSNLIGVRKLIHRLVANAFISNPMNKKTVNHKNGDKTNNNVSNLEWCTQSENMKHSYDSGLRKITKGKNNPMFGRYGSDNNSSKTVLQFDINGVFIAEYSSIKEAMQETGCSKHISCVCKGKRKTAGKYIWKYKN